MRFSDHSHSHQNLQVLLTLETPENTGEGVVHDGALDQKVSYRGVVGQGDGEIVHHKAATRKLNLSLRSIWAGLVSVR